MTESSKNEPQKRQVPKVITHSGPFHADDVLAVAALDLLLEGEYELVRTREPEVIETGDYVLDVGGERDLSRNRFDHHQEGGAGERDGVPYSSIGLVWGQYGEEICGSKEVADMIEEELVKGVDALDCGASVLPKNELGVHIFTLDDVVKSFYPQWDEGAIFDERFAEAFAFTRGLLSREIKKAHVAVEAREEILRAYEEAEDKRIVVLDRRYPNAKKVLIECPEALFYVYPRDDGKWSAQGVEKERESFETRKPFPRAWGGKRGAQMAEISGVEDAFFCHNGLWICGVDSKEGAIKLAALAADA